MEQGEARLPKLPGAVLNQLQLASEALLHDGPRTSARCASPTSSRTALRGSQKTLVLSMISNIPGVEIYPTTINQRGKLVEDAYFVDSLPSTTGDFPRKFVSKIQCLRKPPASRPKTTSRRSDRCRLSIRWMTGTLLLLVFTLPSWLT